MYCNYRVHYYSNGLVGQRRNMILYDSLYKSTSLISIQWSDELQCVWEARVLSGCGRVVIFPTVFYYSYLWKLSIRPTGSIRYGITYSYQCPQLKGMCTITSPEYSRNGDEYQCSPFNLCLNVLWDAGDLREVGMCQRYKYLVNKKLEILFSCFSIIFCRIWRNLQVKQISLLPFGYKWNLDSHTSGSFKVLVHVDIFYSHSKNWKVSSIKNKVFPLKRDQKDMEPTKSFCAQKIIRK